MLPIGVFDSGVGGLGIFKLATQALPRHDFVYFADNANIPFGEKDSAQLNKISENIARFLIEKHQVQMIVIPCNTATVWSLDHLRKKFAIPFVGTVPVVKPACEKTKNKRVAILSTSATADSRYLKNLIAEYANGAEVLVIPCPGLADMVESEDFESPAVRAALQSFLAPALAHAVDIIGLGCTHYTFLRQEIEKLIPPHISILDSNEPVTKQVVRMLGQLPAQAEQADQAEKHLPTYTFYATKDTALFCKVAQKLIGPIVNNCQLAKIDY